MLVFPEAFIGGNMNNLRAGSVLQVLVQLPLVVTVEEGTLDRLRRARVDSDLEGPRPPFDEVVPHDAEQHEKAEATQDTAARVLEQNPIAAWTGGKGTAGHGRPAAQ